MNEKPTLNIVLVEPRIPQNTGNVARTCACTACRLHLAVSYTHLTLPTICSV